MKVLVTGADGMLGSNIVEELHKRQYDISIFVLPNRPKLFPELPLNRIEGNILDVEGIKKAAEGHDAIIHVAALTDVWPYRSEIQRRVNIDGTKNIVAAVRHAGLKRMVMIGSASSCGIGSKENPGTETTPFISDKYRLDYIDSKKEAQDFVVKEARENGLPAIVINPTFMFGKYDSKPGAGAMIAALHQQKVPGYSPGGKNYVCAKDVAVAAVNALTMGRVGEIYIAGNENLDYKEAFEKIGKTINAKVPSLRFPPFVLKSFGWLSAFFCKILNLTPTVNYPMAVIACDDHYFSNEKALHELNMPQTDIEEGIRECFEWMKENGVC